MCEDDTVDVLLLCVGLLLHTNVYIVFQYYEFVILQAALLLSEPLNPESYFVQYTYSNPLVRPK